MKIQLLIIISIFVFCTVHAENTEKRSTKIEGLTCLNFPHIQGEKSLGDLTEVLIIHLFDFEYIWNTFRNYGSEYVASVPEMDYRDILYKCTDEEMTNLSSSETKAYYFGDKEVRYNLLVGNKPFVFLFTPLSEKDIETAKKQGVTVACKPIGLDATIFLNHQGSPVRSLTWQQIHDIYSGKYENWKTLGNDSVDMMNAMVDMDEDKTNIFKQQFMEGQNPVSTSKTLWRINGSIEDGRDRFPFYGICDINKEDIGCIYYTQYLFRTVNYNKSWARIMKVDGVMPTKESILDGTYPYSMYIYAAVNTDKEKYPMANKIYDYLTSEDGQQMLDDYGYIPLKSRQTGITEKHSDKNMDIRYSMGKLFIGDSQMKRQVLVTDFCGKQIISKTLLPTESCINLNVDSGIYIVTVMEQDAKVAVKKIHL